MTGAGLIVVNPPWRLADEAAQGLPWLAGALGASMPPRVDWLIPPTE